MNTQNLRTSMRALVKTILTRPLDHDWSYQGFGMLRLYLGRAKEYRLQIWDPSQATANVSNIHTHPWDFESYVVCGAVYNTRYAVDPQGGMTMNRARLKCGEDACLVAPTQKVRLEPQSYERYSAGQSYTQRAYEVHKSEPEPGTITLLRRVFSSEDVDHADVYWPVGEEWVDAEPRAAARAEVEHFVSRAREILS